MLDSEKARAAEINYYMSIPNTTYSIITGKLTANNKGESVTKSKIFINWKDKNGKEIKLGDKISYYELFQCHSDAIEYFDVEPQNNFPVHEIFIQEKSGIVVYEDCAFRVNGRVLSELGKEVSNEIIELDLMGYLGMDLNSFIWEEYSRLEITKGLSRLVKEIEING
jgi:hypothetical protein